MVSGDQGDVGLRSGLSKTERILAGAFGLMAATGGGVATFMTSNQAGSLGLLGIGAVCGLLALTGQTLQRIKVGDSEASFYERVGRKAVDEALEDPDGRGELGPALAVIESVAASSDTVPTEVKRLAGAREAAARFESAVWSALQRLGMPATTGLSVDFVLGSTGIECKYRTAGRAPGAGSVRPAGSYYPVVVEAADAGLERLVILTNSAVAEEFERDQEVPVGSAQIKVRVAQWLPEDGPIKLRELLVVPPPLAE